MGTSTAVYQLFKPAGGESADVDVVNDNMDKIEAGLVGHDTDIAAHAVRLNGLEAGGGLRGFIVKGADEPVSNESLQNDNELFFTCVANKTYFVDLVLYCIAGANFDQDLKFAFTHPGGTLFYHALGAHNTDLTAGSHSEAEWVSRLNQTASPTATIPIGLSTVITGTVVKCVYQCTQNGALRLQWARNDGSGTITMQAGSNLRFERFDS